MLARSSSTKGFKVPFWKVGLKVFNHVWALQLSICHGSWATFVGFASKLERTLLICMVLELYVKYEPVHSSLI